MRGRMRDIERNAGTQRDEMRGVWGGREWEETEWKKGGLRETTKSGEWFVCPQESHNYIRTCGSVPRLAQN